MIFLHSRLTQSLFELEHINGFAADDYSSLTIFWCIASPSLALRPRRRGSIVHRCITPSRQRERERAPNSQFITRPTMPSTTVTRLKKIIRRHDLGGRCRKRCSLQVPSPPLHSHQWIAIIIFRIENDFGVERVLTVYRITVLCVESIFF